MKNNAARTAWLLAFALLTACGKRDEAPGAGAASPPDSTRADSAASDTAIAKLRMEDGFYVHKDYFENLIRNQSIFGTKFPAGTLSLHFRNDSAFFNYANHDGGGSPVAVLEKEGPVADSSRCYVVKRNDSLITAWERSAGKFMSFLRKPSPRGQIGDLYESLLLNGKYRCRESDPCDEAVIIRGDSLRGINHAAFRLAYTSDWADNMPQMDYFILENRDHTLYYAYRIFDDLLSLYAIELPAACKSMRDYQCPLSEAKIGDKLFEMEKIDD
jgi:hypothetical protein